MFLVSTALVATVLSCQLDPLIPTWKTIRESKKGRFSIDVAYPIFPNAHPLAKLTNDLVNKTIKASISNFKKDFAEFYDSDRPEWDLTIESIISRNDTKVMSILFYRTDYTAGNHPNTHTDVINVAVIKNRAQSITLADIASPNTTSYRILNDLVLPKINDARLKRTNDSENTLTELPESFATNFIISKIGLTFIYDAYTFGSYSEGNYDIKLSWAELKGRINRQIIPEAFD